ncbi:hypothetical protein ACWW2I_002412 [Escherichia coli]
MLDNLFDQAMSDADDIILDTMGMEISIYPGGTERRIRAVFDAPADNTGMTLAAAKFVILRPCYLPGAHGPPV